jgi:electron transfer flavoprotein beta subunit
MRAKSAKIQLFNALMLDCEQERLGLKGSPTQVVKIFSPERRKGGALFQGPAEESVDKIVDVIKSLLP